MPKTKTNGLVVADWKNQVSFFFFFTGIISKEEGTNDVNAIANGFLLQIQERDLPQKKSRNQLRKERRPDRMSLAFHFLDELFSHSRALSIERNAPTKIQPPRRALFSFFSATFRFWLYRSLFGKRKAMKQVNPIENPSIKGLVPSQVDSDCFFFFMSTDPTVWSRPVPRQTESIRL